MKCPITTYNRRRWLAILLAGLSAIALTSCNPNQFKSQAAQLPQLVASILTSPKTFNYALNQTAPSVFSFIYEGLISENGVTGKIEPALAESWQISADKLRIVFTLRQGLKWSDGEPLTVDDVVFTYNDIYLNEKISTDIRDTLKIGEKGALPKVKKLDDRRVEFSIPEPFAPFLRSTGLAILPAHSLRESVKSLDSQGKPKFISMWGIDTDPKKIIVNGPYRMSIYQAGERVIFERNPYYWRKDAEGNRLPYIDRFIWQIVENVDTQLIQFRSGGLDMLGVSPLNFSLLKREEKRGNFTIYNGGQSSGTSFICFNLNKGKRNGKPLIDPMKSRWFNTVGFRQAVAYGIDRQTMINNLFRGLAETQNSPISVQSPYYLSPQEGLKVYDYNPEKAKKLLLGAGFKYNNKGQLIDADGNRVRFTLLTNTGSRTAEAIVSQTKQDLSKIGIQVDVSLIEFNALVDKFHNTFDWEAYFGGITGGIEPNDGANIWLPSGGLHRFNQAPAPDEIPIVGREIADWEAEIGRLYIQGAKELDEAKRKVIYAETQRISQEYLPFIYLVNPLSLAAVRNEIEGVNFSGMGGLLWNIAELKINKNSPRDSQKYPE
ncbi:ABC transporter substrate-binding protein [Planktothrix sp. FACHB-1355]|uniref:ABC transporter substrate-binding protein n=1 Tax=Planktothrix sp. FACHB-1355 TaxID=2692854 RepID=UPI00168B596B|nr:ABC transporter substrate-binding protein [Planktothrix sp. FACHB-1355]MBD3560702.1 ABC transporter substrate-binding protein [Planktothrix sp. FACHB-1355]